MTECFVSGFFKTHVMPIKCDDVCVYTIMCLNNLYQNVCVCVLGLFYWTWTFMSGFRLWQPSCFLMNSSSKKKWGGATFKRKDYQINLEGLRAFKDQLQQYLIFSNGVPILQMNTRNCLSLYVINNFEDIFMYLYSIDICKHFIVLSHLNAFLYVESKPNWWWLI